MIELNDYLGYLISEKGEVISINYNNRGYSRPLKQHADGAGYLTVSLYKDGKKVCFKAHKLVALAFIPNPENKPTVNHKDGNKSNNHVSNLEWATRSENCQHAWDNGLNKRSEKCTKAVSESVSVKVICQVTKNIFPNVRNAALVFGCSESHMSMMLRGKRTNKTTFKYL